MFSDARIVLPIPVLAAKLAGVSHPGAYDTSMTKLSGAELTEILHYFKLLLLMALGTAIAIGLTLLVAGAVTEVWLDTGASRLRPLRKRQAPVVAISCANDLDSQQAQSTEQHLRFRA